MGQTWIRTGLEKLATGSASIGTQYLKPAGLSNMCYKCSSPLPFGSGWAKDRVLEKEKGLRGPDYSHENPGKGKQVPCNACIVDGESTGKHILDGREAKWVKNKKIQRQCQTCDGSKEIDSPELKSAIREMKESFKGRIPCGTCGVKNDMRKTVGRHKPPDHIGSRKCHQDTGSWNSIQNMIRQRDILTERLENLADSSINIDGIKGPDGTIRPAVIPCSRCHSTHKMHSVEEKGKMVQRMKPAWLREYQNTEHYGITDRRSPKYKHITDWARGKTLDEGRNAVDCSDCGGSERLINRDSTHVPGGHQNIFTWLKAQLKMSYHSQDSAEPIDIPLEEDNIDTLVKAIKKRNSYLKMPSEIGDRFGESQVTKRGKKLIGQIRQLAKPGFRVFLPHHGFGSRVQHDTSHRNYDTHNGFRDLHSVKAVSDFIEKINRVLQSNSGGDWAKMDKRFNSLLQYLSANTPYSFPDNNIGPGLDNAGTYVVSNEFEKFEEYITKNYEKLLEIDKPDDEQKEEMKKMKHFLILAHNIYDLKESVGDMAEGSDFFSIGPLGSPNSYDKSGCMVEDPSMCLPTITDPDRAEKLLRTMTGPPGKAGYPKIDFFDKSERIRRMVRDGVPDHVIEQLRGALEDASWGVPGTTWYDRLKGVIQEGKEAEIVRRVNHFPRTMQDNKGLEDEATQKLIDKHTKRLDFQHDDNQTIGHTEWSRPSSPQIETQPEEEADGTEDIERSETPLDMAWDIILKNIKIVQ